jgi:hypothetical protein
MGDVVAMLEKYIMVSTNITEIWEYKEVNLAICEPSSMHRVFMFLCACIPYLGEVKVRGAGLHNMNIVCHYLWFHYTFIQVISR